MATRGLNVFAMRHDILSEDREPPAGLVTAARTRHQCGIITSRPFLQVRAKLFSLKKVEGIIKSRTHLTGGSSTSSSQFVAVSPIP